MQNHQPLPGHVSRDQFSQMLVHIEGYDIFEDGSTHFYRAHSGPAISVGNGMHVYYYAFYTTEDDGYLHRIRGVDHSAPGNH